MTDRGLRWWLGVVACAAIVGFVFVFVTRNDTGEDALMLEVGKGLLQLVVIGVLGTMLKLLADAHQANRLRAEQRAEFWRKKYTRLVEATNRLRRIPLLLPADTAPDALRRHMVDVLDVAAELRVIKHEIQLTKGLPDSPFRDIDRVTSPLEDMYGYADTLAIDFKEVLGWHGTANREWEKLQTLPAVKDLLDSVNVDAAGSELTWIEYVQRERRVLRLITRATLGERRIDADKDPIAPP